MSEQTVGEHIRDARLDAELTQAQLAKLMRTEGFPWSQSTVWGIEQTDWNSTTKTKRKLTLLEAVALSGILGMSLHELAGVEEPGDRVGKLRRRVLQLESLMREIGRLSRVGEGA